MNKLIIIIIILLSSELMSQELQKDTQKQSDILLSINHTFQIPGGDLSDRFGNNSNISMSIIYKNKHDFTITLEGGVIFGSEIKEKYNIYNLFAPIIGDDGDLISQNGETPEIRLFERGGMFDINFGKYFKFNSTENESGILVSIGLGYIYHKIFIETIVTELPQLNDELLKGYDRLAGGVSIKQFVGYLYFSENNNIRFLIGLETVQGFTKDLREYNYTSQTYVHEKRLDHLIGLKTGFIIPIKKRNTGKYYYY